MLELEDGVWEIEGATDLYTAEQVLGTDGLVDDDQEYSSINGFLLERFGTVPHVGQSFEYNGYRFEVTEMDGRSIVKVRVTRVEKTAAGRRIKPDSSLMSDIVLFRRPYNCCVAKKAENRSFLA